MHQPNRIFHLSFNNVFICFNNRFSALKICLLLKNVDFLSQNKIKYQKSLLNPKVQNRRFHMKRVKSLKIFSHWVTD